MSAAGVILVEDDDETRAHLVDAIEKHPQLRLIGGSSGCNEARKLLSSNRPDVFLTDLGLPDGDGIDLIRAVRAQFPKALIMVVTVFGDESSVVKSLEAGASGYLLKDGTHQEIGEAVMQLVEGGSPISASIARYLLKRFHALPQRSQQADAAAESAPKLSQRETEVLELIAKGFSFPEIAELLEISSHTVTTHVRHIYQKLEVSSRGAAVYEAVNLGIISMGE